MSTKPIYRFETKNSNDYSEFSIDISAGTLLLKNNNGHTIEFDNNWNSLKNKPNTKISLDGAVYGDVVLSELQSGILHTKFNYKLIDDHVRGMFNQFITRTEFDEFKLSVMLDGGITVKKEFSELSDNDRQLLRTLSDRQFGVNGQKVESFDLIAGKNIRLTLHNDKVILDSDINWASIADKPSEFYPSKHSHSYTEIKDIPEFVWENIQNKPNRFDPIDHTHDWNSITGKPSELQYAHINDIPELVWENIQNKPNKFDPIDHIHDWDSIKNKPSEFVPIEHSHSYSEIKDIPNIEWNSIKNKPFEFSPVRHIHNWESIKDKPSEFVPIEHTHSYHEIKDIPDITWDIIKNKPSEFVPIEHSHDWKEITNKPSEFVPIEHTHSYNEIKDIPDIEWNQIKNKPFEFNPVRHNHEDKVGYDIVGQPNGLAVLNDSGYIATHQLPSYVDEIVEYQTVEKFPYPGTKSKIYIASDTLFVYRWTGRVYVRVNDSVSLSDETIRLSTARRIELKGTVSGRTYFDGSHDAVIHTTIDTIDGGEF